MYKIINFLKFVPVFDKVIFFINNLRFQIKNVSYSQAGEDAILRFLFFDYGKKVIEYLDLGTNKPTLNNNTYWFYKNGSKGTCVEADIDLVKLIQKRRGLDNIIHAGVSVSDSKEALFYIFDQPAINTFNKEEADLRLKSGVNKLLKTINVPLIKINDLIRNNFINYPDLLSIDIEGLDLDVLKEIDYHSYPIPVICVESCDYSETHIKPKDNQIIEFLTSIGYEVYADTYINTIFVNRKWFYKIN